jgi:hypothetical protein
MTHVDIITSTHSFKTTLDFAGRSDDIIDMSIKTECPYLGKLVEGQIYALDPMIELFKSDNSVLSDLAEQLPHRACPFLFSALKGLEVEAKLDKSCDFQVTVKRHDDK